MTQLMELKHPALAACIAAAEAASDPSESIANILFPPRPFSNVLARALAHRAVQTLSSKSALPTTALGPDVTFKSIIKAIRQYREQKMDVPVDLIEAAFTFLVLLCSSFDSTLPYSFRLLFEAIGSEARPLLTSIVCRMSRDSKLQSLLDRPIEVWAVVTMLDESYMQMTTALPKRLIAILVRSISLSGLIACPYSQTSSAHLASIVQRMLEEEKYAIEMSTSLALPICDLCNCFLEVRTEPYHILQICGELRWSALNEAGIVTVLIAISDIISRNFGDFSLQLELAVGVLLKIWDSGLPRMKLSKAEQLLIVTKISRMVLVPGQALWLKSFLDWLLNCHTDEGRINKPTMKSARQGFFLYLERQISELRVILLMEHLSDQRIINYAPVPWFLLPNVRDDGDTRPLKSLLEPGHDDAKCKKELQTNRGKETLGAALISLKMGCTSKTSNHVIRTLKAICCLNTESETTNSNRLTMSISHVAVVYSVAQRLVSVEAGKDFLKTECVRLRLYTTQWCENGGQGGLCLIISQWRVVWKALTNRSSYEEPLLKEMMLCLALTGEQLCSHDPGKGQLFATSLRDLISICINHGDEQDIFSIIAVCCRAIGHLVLAGKISYEITMDVFGRLISSELLNSSLAIQTAYMEMVCAGRCVAECTTEGRSKRFLKIANKIIFLNVARILGLHPSKVSAWLDPCLRALSTVIEHFSTLWSEVHYACLLEEDYMEPDWFQILNSIRPSNPFLHNGLEALFRNEDQERNRIAKGRDRFVQENNMPQPPCSQKSSSSVIWSESIKDLWQRIQPYFESGHTTAIAGGPSVLNEISQESEGMSLAKILYSNAERLYQSIFSVHIAFPLNIIQVTETCCLLANTLYCESSDPIDVLAKMISDIYDFSYREQISQASVAMLTASFLLHNIPEDSWPYTGSNSIQEILKQLVIGLQRQTISVFGRWFVFQAIESCANRPHFLTAASKQLKDFISKFISQEPDRFERSHNSYIELAVISYYYPNEVENIESQMSLQQPNFSAPIIVQSESSSSHGMSENMNSGHFGKRDVEIISSVLSRSRQYLDFNSILTYLESVNKSGDEYSVMSNELREHIGVIALGILRFRAARGVVVTKKAASNWNSLMSRLISLVANRKVDAHTKSNLLLTAAFVFTSISQGKYSTKDEFIQLLKAELERIPSHSIYKSIQESRLFYYIIWSGCFCFASRLRGRTNSKKNDTKLETENTRHLRAYRSKGAIVSTVQYLENLVSRSDQPSTSHNTACEVLGSIARALGPGNVLYDVQWERILTVLLSAPNNKSAMEFGGIHYPYRKEIASVMNSFLWSTNRCELALQASFSVELSHVYVKTFGQRLKHCSWRSFTEYCKFVTHIAQQNSTHEEVTMLGVSSMMDQWGSRIHSLSFKSLIDADDQFGIIPVHSKWVGCLWQLAPSVQNIFNDECSKILGEWSEACCAFRKVQDFWKDFAREIIINLGTNEKVLVLISNAASISEEVYSAVRTAIDESLAFRNSILKTRICAASIEKICSIYASRSSDLEEQRCLRCFELFSSILSSLQLVLDGNAVRDSSSFPEDVYRQLRVYATAFVEPCWSYCCQQFNSAHNSSLGKHVEQSLTSLTQILIKLIDYNEVRLRRIASDLYWLFDLVMRYKCFLPIQQLSIFVYRMYQHDNY